MFFGAPAGSHGKLDIIISFPNGCDPFGSSLAIYGGNGDGTFASPDAISLGHTSCLNDPFQPEAIGAVDLNCDGKLDLISPLADDNNVAVVLTPGGTDTTPPTITAPPDVSVATTGSTCNQVVTDAQLGNATATGNCSCVTVTRSGVPAGNIFPVGTTVVTYTAKDGAGNTASATQAVTVTAPPLVFTSAKATPSVLWPPDHKMITVTLSYATSGGCGSTTCGITSVTSNEPVDGLGDGDTAPDWIIVDATHVLLRAERSGNGTGRVYTITITCTNTGGSATKTVKVTVPFSQ